MNTHTPARMHAHTHASMLTVFVGGPLPEGTDWLWHYVQLHEMANAVCNKWRVMQPLVGTLCRCPTLTVTL